MDLNLDDVLSVSTGVGTVGNGSGNCNGVDAQSQSSRGRGRGRKAIRDMARKSINQRLRRESQRANTAEEKSRELKRKADEAFPQIFAATGLLENILTQAASLLEQVIFNLERHGRSMSSSSHEHHRNISWSTSLAC